MQLPYVALAALVGGNVRVGLEDNLYLARGVPATNAQLVERAVTILEAMGARVLGPGRGARAPGAPAACAERLATVALLGGGVIGGGWAARFLLNGDRRAALRSRARRRARRWPRCWPTRAAPCAG